MWYLYLLLTMTDDGETTTFTERRFSHRTIVRLKVKYACICIEIKCILEERKININNLIISLCATDDRNLTVFSTDEAFKMINSIDKLFLQIGKYCSMYDFDLLLALVESTKCQEAVKLLDDFTEELRCSILKDLNLLSEDGELLNPCDFMENTHKLVIKYLGNTECTLETKEKIKNVVYGCFRLKKGCITFKGVQEGCVAKAYMMQIKVTPSDVTTFAEHHIISVSIDDEKLKISSQVAINKLHFTLCALLEVPLSF